METVRMTVAQAIVRFLIAQRVDDGGGHLPLFAGVFAIFGHGNVTCLGEALEPVQSQLPTWRGQNEAGMAMAAIGFARARRRRQVMVVTTSIGPGALNVVTAAGIALANRLPLLILSGDTFVNRLPDPVLQQVEHPHDPTRTVNDAFRPVVRYWDRITHPAQLIQTLPQMVSLLLDPAECGPAFIALPQDVQAAAFDFPAVFFGDRVHRIRRSPADREELRQAANLVRSAHRPLIIAGGGIRYSGAEAELDAFATRHRVPVTETMAGKGSLGWQHPNQVGPIGVTGSTSGNAAAAEADLVLAIGTRLGDFATGSWSAFDPEMKVVAINASRYDASKHLAQAVIGDAGLGLGDLGQALGTWQAPSEWLGELSSRYSDWTSYTDGVTSVDAPTKTGLPSYAQVIGCVNQMLQLDDYAVAAAGGLPGELNKTWRMQAPGTFDCEYGFSCMGYEISGSWGARLARTKGEVISFCGDGSYLMLNSDIFSSVLSGQKLIVILCDNGGYAVIQRLQEFTGGIPFNNRYEEGTRRARPVEVDYASHAASMGALSESVSSIAELKSAFLRARAADRTYVIVIRTDPYTWTAGDAWWDVGVPEVSARSEVRVARAQHEAERKRQRLGI
ncbi:MAG TPA: 3D-(3,5/4)-trihydroxycyclohexane-1,2-dione acylhydrolase (decyclizing) [Acidimicrobiia bacterium]|nr:3D-(3,5/4)-trihydroxycyclohexane-1,2-dione acylhydrolase (decyclizing) [Acidimicrobiia bacterium]